jgi:pimeloyl-ACP methyl ester carboxylesterase
LICTEISLKFQTMKRRHLFPDSGGKVTMLLITIVVLAGCRLCAQTKGVKNILLIHGTFADGSGWQGVFRILTAKGYNVTVVQNPCGSMDEDVTAVKRAMDRETGPCILVGHSHGGAVITEAGSDDRVVGLVYVDGFVPDSGETAVAMDPTVPDLTNGGVLPPDASGLIYFDKTKFHAGFCADLPAAQAEFMSASQIPGAVKAFTARISHAPWKTKPCWAILGTEDKAINPILLRRLYQRSNAKVTEIKGASHVSFISHPGEVAEVIDAAARGSY